MNATNFASSSFASLAPRLYEMSGMKPQDVDVVQSYENFTIGVMMAVVEHGFCDPDDCNEFFQIDNLVAPNGKMPLNTSGGNLAECYSTASAQIEPPGIRAGQSGSRRRRRNQHSGTDGPSCQQHYYGIEPLWQELPGACLSPSRWVTVSTHLIEATRHGELYRSALIAAPGNGDRSGLSQLPIVEHDLGEGGARRHHL